MTCKVAADCPKGGFACKNSVCACPVDTPDVCGTGAEATCVAKANDAENCGECAAACEAGAACVAGQCGAKPVELATSAGCGSMRLVIQGTALHWAEKASGKIRSVPLAGGAATDLATGQTSPTQIAADAEAVYWLTQGDVAGMSKIWKKPLGSTEAPVRLQTVTLAATETIPAIAVAGGRLYYAVDHHVHAISTDETETAFEIVGRAINLDSGTPVESGEPSGLAVKGDVIAWTTANRQGVEADDIDATDDAQMGYVELGQSQGSLLLQDIALDATYAYWANGPNFVRNALTAMSPVPDPAITVTPGFDDITAFAITGTDVYAATATGQVLKHALLPPSDPDDESTVVPPLVLARDQASVSSVVVDAARVYWATGDCAVRSTPL